MKRIKVLLMLLAMMAGGSFAYGQSGTCGDNLTWEYDPSTTTLTISGSGAMWDYNTSTDRAPWKNFINDITTVVIESGATSIGKSAFAGCTALASVTIPDGVTIINASAFAGCTALTSITIPGTVGTIQNSAFYGCSSLADITIYRATAPSVAPATFMNIASSATLHVPYGASKYTGSNWNMFTIVEMNPSGQCGDDLFWEYNPSTYTLTITGTGDMWDWYDAPDVPWHSYTSKITTVVLPNGLTTIGELAFSACYELTSITIPEGVTTIGNCAFYSCLMLTSVTIPEGVTTINRLAFADCQALTSIEIPATVTTIGAIAFATGDNLASVTVNWTDLSGVTTAANAFSDIASGATLHVPCGTKSAYEAKEPWSSFTIDDPCSGQCGDNLFWQYNPSTTTLTITGSGAIYDYNNSSPRAPWYDYRNSITSVVLPNGITSIGNYAFKGCAGLVTITLPEGLTSIGNSAFYGCSSLTSIDIPSSVTVISASAFNSCSSLTSAIIPEGVTTIQTAIFMGCTNLASVTIPSSVTNFAAAAFNNCTSLADMYVSWETSIPSTNNSTFTGLNVANIRLHVPCGTKSAYAAASPWSSFTIDDPCEGHYPITAKADPNDASTYYSTFYYGTAKYLVPAYVEAYAAAVSGTDLVLTKIADAGEVLPAGTAVILKSTKGSYTMVPSTDAAITNTAGNQLLGVDDETAAPPYCYVLSGHSSDNSIVEVGFYTFSGTLGAHKAYIVLPGSSGAPKRLRFVFDSAMDIEQPTSDSSLKGGEKILLDGVLYIERGEHLYNAQGVRVK